MVDGVMVVVVVVNNNNNNNNNRHTNSCPPGCLLHHKTDHRVNKMTLVPHAEGKTNIEDNRSALGPTQPPIKWVQESLPQG
jgi:hypothetical protein